MTSLKLFLILYYIKQIDSKLPCLFSNRSQRTSQCGKNISGTLGCALCATFLFLRHFDVICYLLLNRRMATRNLFVNSITILWMSTSKLIHKLVSIKIDWWGENIHWTIITYLNDCTTYFLKSWQWIIWKWNNTT